MPTHYHMKINQGGSTYVHAQLMHTQHDVISVNMTSYMFMSCMNKFIELQCTFGLFYDDPKLWCKTKLLFMYIVYFTM